jgi:hypothetical protein
MLHLDRTIVAERVRQELHERALRGYIVDGLCEEWQKARNDGSALIVVRWKNWTEKPFNVKRKPRVRTRQEWHS